MLPRTTVRLRGRRLLFLAALLAAPALLPGPARADLKKDTALSLIPADAAFFSANLRNKEQIDLVLKSNAYKKLRSLPAVKEAMKQLDEQMKKEDGPLAGWMKLYKNKDAVEALHVLRDALYQEIFVYGGSAWIDLLGVMMQVNNAQQFAPLEELLGGGDPSKAQPRAILRTLDKNRQKIKIPDLVLGFKVGDTKKAQAQLDKLQKLLAAMLKDNELLKDKFKVTQVAGSPFLTLTLEGTMLPWQMADLSEIEEKKGEFDDLVKYLKGLKAVISLGLRGDYLLLSVTGSADVVANLGKGKLLVDTAELKPLVKNAEKKLTSIGYVSKALRGGGWAGSVGDLDAMSKRMQSMVDKADIDAKRKAAIKKDIGALFKEMAGHEREVGGALNFAYMVEGGMEGYAYAYGEAKDLKGLKTRLVNHLGGNPIFGAWVGTKVDGTGYAALVKWLKVIHGHAEAVFMEKAPDEPKDFYKKFTKDFFPLLKRLDEATAKLLIPSLKDGGLGIVLDAKWKSKRWQKDMPDFKKELPMPELGLILGISDSAKFTRAMKEYRTTINEIYEKFRDAAPNKDNIPEFKIPAPESDKVKGGTTYYWKIPDEAGLDKQVQPNFGVGKSAAVITFSKSHTERLLTPKPLAFKGGPLARKNIVGGCFLDFPALIDAVSPWVEVAVGVATIYPADDKDAADKAKKKAAEISKQVQTALGVLKAFRGFSAATYVEGNAVVTHSLAVVKDIE